MKINHKKYSSSLEDRGDISQILTQQVLKDWYRDSRFQNKKTRQYSDSTIKALLALRFAFNKDLRSAMGIARSYLHALGREDLKVPSFNRVCERASVLGVILLPFKGRGRFVIFDSTGLSKWPNLGYHNRNLNPADKGRGHYKLHALLDAETLEVIAYKVTTHRCHDTSPSKELLKALPGKPQVIFADGAWDSKQFWKWTKRQGIKLLVPPRKGAKLSPDKGLEERNEIISQVEMLKDLGMEHQDASKVWKIISRYHQRSLVETLFHRFKMRFTSWVRSKKMATIKTEIGIKLRLLNKQPRMATFFE